MDSRKHLGNFGEELAVKFLQSNGFKIESRNVRTRFGEIDIVGWDEETLVFVEVKTIRTKNFVSPVEKYTKKQRQRLRRMAEYYLTKNTKSYSAVRFDFVGVTMSGKQQEITHLKNIEL